MSGANHGATPGTPARPRARFFGTVPRGYEKLNRDLLAVAPLPRPEPPLPDRAGFQEATSTHELDRVVKVVPLPVPIPPEVSSSAILGMERLRDQGMLTALRGRRPTDLPRPDAGQVAETVRRHAPALIETVEHVEDALSGSRLFVRAIKLDRARLSTTAPVDDPAASNLHFDAEQSSLADYSEPVFQFYLNAGQFDRQFRILPFRRDTILAGVCESERRTLPLEAILKLFLATHPPLLETIPVESGALAIFDGRQFAHDAGKADVEALATGRFEPSSEPDLVIALDTVKTGYHQGLYRPELPFFEDSGGDHGE